jgi:CheY-like chemotaxis protein
MAPMSLRRAIEEQLALLKPMAQEKDLDLVLDFDADVPDYIVGDEVRIRQILSNLIGNAIKFTPDGMIRLQVARGREDGTLQFVVSDTGIGMPTDKLDHIFDTFTQIYTRGARKAQGTGLGLAICKHLVEMMGGAIRVESTEGLGSTFSYWIRYDLPSLEDVDALERELDIRPSGDNAHFTAHILVVEDVATNQFVITDMLEDLGCTVDLADNGAEGVEKVATTSYDLVFMDCQMPVMDGFEATRDIRNAGHTQLPIVALTANALKGDREKCLEAGMDGFVSKPVSRTEIIEVLNRWLEEKKGHAA